MAEWLLAEKPKLLLDPGVGSGALMIAAGQARKDGATRLLGLDVDPLALAMAAATRDVRRIKKLELRRADFLLDDLDERPQAITCNPPYTRHQDIPADLKSAIHDGFASRLDRSFSRLASLHVLFLLRALEVADNDARIAFLTPAHWLDMNYARAIKATLLEHAHVEALISFPVKERIFDHAVTTAAITLIRKSADPAARTRVVRLSSADSTESGSAQRDQRDISRANRPPAHRSSLERRKAHPAPQGRDHDLAISRACTAGSRPDATRSSYSARDGGGNSASRSATSCPASRRRAISKARPSARATSRRWMTLCPVGC